MTPDVGDVIHGLDITGREVRGRVTAVHDVDTTQGPYSAGPVAVVDVRNARGPLVALVRAYDVKDIRPAPLGG